MDHKIRPITPADRSALVRFHARLSAETRYRRYHGAKGELTRAELRYLTEVNGVDHVAAVAIDAWGEIDAVARVIVGGEAAEGEVAVVVADDRRRLGLGERVTQTVLREFAAQGHAGPVAALVQPDNRPALELFLRLGGKVGRRAPGEPVTLLLSPGKDARAGGVFGDR